MLSPTVRGRRRILVGALALLALGAASCDVPPPLQRAAATQPALATAQVAVPGTFSGGSTSWSWTGSDAPGECYITATFEATYNPDDGSAVVDVDANLCLTWVIGATTPQTIYEPSGGLTGTSTDGTFTTEMVTEASTFDASVGSPQPRFDFVMEITAATGTYAADVGEQVRVTGTWAQDNSIPEGPYLTTGTVAEA